jgi:hypothetical protein
MSVHEEDHISELVAPYVLGALEPEEVEHVELHLEQCALCRALVEEERRVVRALPYLAEPRPVPRQARHNLLKRIEREATPVPSSRWKVLLPSGRSGWIAAATAAVLALVFAVNSFQMQGEMEKRDQEASEDRANIAEVVQSRGSWMTSLEGSSLAPGAGGGIIVDPTTNAAILVVDGLEQPDEGHAYVVWMVNGGDHVYVGNLQLDDNGRGQLYITGRGALANYEGLIITEEVDDTQVAGPTGEEIMAATFE